MKKMEYGGSESGHLVYTTDVLRKARQESKDKEFGVQDSVAFIND